MKQLLAVLVCCVVSVGCVADEKQESLCPAINDNHPIRQWMTKEIDADKKPTQDVLNEAHDKWYKEIDDLVKSISSDLRGDIKERFLKDQKEWEKSIVNQNNFVERLVLTSHGGSGSLAGKESMSIKLKLLQLRLCQLEMYKKKSEEFSNNFPVDND